MCVRFSIPVLLLLAAASTALGDPNTPGRTAHAAPRFTLLSGGPGPKPPVMISVIRITPDLPGRPSQLVYLDSTGTQKSMPLRDAVALAPAWWVPTSDGSGPAPEGPNSDLPLRRLDLTDSQRLVGSLMMESDDASAAGKPSEAPVLFHHETLGTFSFPLDRVARYSPDARRAPDLGGRPLSTASDTVLLGNSDRLEGLVTRLGPVIWIETRPLATAGAGAPAKPREQATQIDADAATLVNLVNPPVPLKSVRVDLADRSVIAVDVLSADTQTGVLALHPVDAPKTAVMGGETSATSMDIGQLAGVVPNPSRITALSTIAFVSQAPAAGRTALSPAQVLADAGAPLGAADILLPGPMTVEWTLPAGASGPVSIIGYAQMDDRSFAWGDCTVVLSVAPKSGAQRELARGRLNADSPLLTIAADLGALSPGDRLRIRTEAGERGAIQDRVVLRRMLLIGK